MNSNDQYASYNQRIDDICNELSIIGDRVSSLEELTELPISDDKPDKSYIDDESGIFKFSEYLRDYLDGRNEAVKDCDDTCQGDMLGQCEHGCDGISDRGSCIAIPKQCPGGCDGESAWGSCASGCPDPYCKIAENGYKTSDQRFAYLPAIKVEIAQCGRPANLCRSCSPAMHEAMSMPACKQGERACKYELSVDDSCDYSDKPRRARVDNDDLSIADGVDSGLGGSTERKDSEHKANMAIDDGVVVDKAYIRCFMGYETGQMIEPCDVEAYVLHRLNRAMAPVATVYCMGGACYA